MEIPIRNILQITESIKEPRAFGTQTLKQNKKESVTLLLKDEKRALERCLTHFSDLEKETVKADRQDEYFVTIRYRKSEERDILIRILSFGSSIEILSPDNLREEMQNLLAAQLVPGKEPR